MHFWSNVLNHAQTDCGAINNTDLLNKARASNDTRIIHTQVRADVLYTVMYVQHPNVPPDLHSVMRDARPGHRIRSPVFLFHVHHAHTLPFNSGCRIDSYRSTRRRCSWQPGGLKGGLAGDCGVPVGRVQDVPEESDMVVCVYGR